MVTKTAQMARVEMFANLKNLQAGWNEIWVDRSIPKDWDYMEERYPVRPKKMKLTVTLDEDLVKWFRKLGRGYQARMNAILRIYWRGLVSGDVQSHWDEHDVGPQQLAYLDGLNAKLMGKFAEAEAEGRLEPGTTEQAEQDIEKMKAMFQQMTGK